LARLASLDFDPSQISPVIVLVDHLYMLKIKLFFDPKAIRAPARHEYRVKVVTYLNYEGGDAETVEDVNLDKRIGWFELQRTLLILTQNIQAAQLAYNYGFQTGGYHGKWVYWANETDAPEGFILTRPSHILYNFLHLSFKSPPQIFRFSFTPAPDLRHLIGPSRICNKLLTFDGMYRPSRGRLEIIWSWQMPWAWGWTAPWSRVSPCLRVTPPSSWENIPTSWSSLSLAEARQMAVQLPR
jgi:hypothetical protein